MLPLIHLSASGRRGWRARLPLSEGEGRGEVVRRYARAVRAPIGVTSVRLFRFRGGRSSRPGCRPRARAPRGLLVARRWWHKKLQLVVDHYAGNLAGCRRDPLARKLRSELFEARPILRLQRDLLNFRRTFQGRPSARRAHPRLQFPTQCVKADRSALSILSGHDLIRAERFGDRVRTDRSERCADMTNPARGVTRDLELACHTGLRHSSYSLMRKNHDPSVPLSSTTTTSWFVSRPKRWRNSRSAATCARNRSGLM